MNALVSWRGSHMIAITPSHPLSDRDHLRSANWRWFFAPIRGIATICTRGTRHAPRAVQTSVAGGPL